VPRGWEQCAVTVTAWEVASQHMQIWASHESERKLGLHRWYLRYLSLVRYLVRYRFVS